QKSLDVFGLFPPVTEPPAAPSDLSGEALTGGTQIKLTWTNNATNATGIKIYRSLDGTNFTQVNTVAQDVNTYTDTGLIPSTLYYYYVKATNQLGDSPPSDTLSIRARIAAPVLQIKDVCVGEITLSWTSTANDHYTVERSDDGTNFTVIASNISANVTTYT